VLKVIYLDKEFCIRMDYFSLGHKCTSGEVIYYIMINHAIRNGRQPYCVRCEEIVPDKVMTMYKLWMFHNETG